MKIQFPCCSYCMRGVPDVACMNWTFQSASESPPKTTTSMASASTQWPDPTLHRSASHRSREGFSRRTRLMGSLTLTSSSMGQSPTVECVRSTQASFGLCLHTVGSHSCGWGSTYLIPCLSQTASSVLSVCLHYRDRLFFYSPIRLDRQDPFVCLSFHLRRYEASQSSSQPISFWTLFFNLHSILKQPRCTSQY